MRKITHSGEIIHTGIGKPIVHTGIGRQVNTRIKKEPDLDNDNLVWYLHKLFRFQNSEESVKVWRAIGKMPDDEWKGVTDEFINEVKKRTIQELEEWLNEENAVYGETLSSFGVKLCKKLQEMKRLVKKK